MNEQGFTYPLTLCMVLLFLLIFSFRVELLLSERKLMNETATILQEEYYFHSTIRKIEKMLQDNGALPAKGSIYYTNGKIDFQSEKPIGTIQKITFSIQLHTGEKQIAYGFFDINFKKLVRWTEMY